MSGLLLKCSLSHYLGGHLEKPGKLIERAQSEGSDVDKKWWCSVADPSRLEPSSNALWLGTGNSNESL